MNRTSSLAYIRNKRRTSTMFIRSLKTNTSKSKSQVIHSSNNDQKQRVKSAFEYPSDDLRHDLEQALDDIRYLAAHYAYEAFIESVRDEWKYIAIVMDRVQFILFSLVNIIGSLALFFQVNHFLIVCFSFFDHYLGAGSFSMESFTKRCFSSFFQPEYYG